MQREKYEEREDRYKTGLIGYQFANPDRPKETIYSTMDSLKNQIYFYNSVET
jgi:hypothetical protein